MELILLNMCFSFIQFLPTWLFPFGPLFGKDCTTHWASLVVQRLKCLPAIWETWVRSLGQEDPLEKEMATHTSILAWRIPWTEELGGLQPTGHKELDTTERLHFHFRLDWHQTTQREF